MRAPLPAAFILTSISGLLSAPILASAPQSGTGTAGGDEASAWRALDTDLDEMLEDVTGDSEGMPHLSGMFRANWRHSNDAEDELGNNLSRVEVANAQFILSGTTGDHSYRVSYEMGEGNLFDDGANLEDAYLTVGLPQDFKATVGQFTAPVLRSGLVTDDRTLFLDHTFLGAVFETRDEGVMLQRDWQDVRGALAVQDGLDGPDTDYVYTARVAVDLIGQGVSKVEGAFGASPDLAATVGVAYLDDSGINDGELWAFEAAATYDRLAVAAELVTAADGYDGDAADGTPKSLIGDATPFGLTVSYMLKEDLEAGWRFDYLDTPDNTHIQTFGANYYMNGHDLKWQFQLQLIEPEGPDDHILGIGLSASF